MIFLFLAAPAWAQVNFSVAQNYETGAGSASWDVTTGDLDGDGQPDLAAANYNSDDISVLLGRPDGTFGASANTQAGDGPSSTATADFDGDSNLDLAVTNAESGNVSVLLGNGDGAFQAAQDYEVGPDADSVAVNDFDGDGHEDLVVANQDLQGGTLGGVSILLNTGDGTFDAAYKVSSGGTPRSVVTGDFDGDHQADLAVAYFGSGPPIRNVAVHLGNGDGTFQAASWHQAGNYPLFITTGNFDGDKGTDLAVTNWYGEISIFLNQGDGTLGEAANYGAGRVYFSIAVADFDGDGVQDLAGTGVATADNCCEENLQVLRGEGDGTFAAPLNYRITTGEITTGDFNSDGRADLAGTYSYGQTTETTPGPGDISVLLNISSATSKLSLGAKPKAVKKGKSTTLSGKLTSPSAARLDGEQVILQKRPAGTRRFKPLQVVSVQADDIHADGTFSVNGVKPRRTTYYRVVFKGDEATGLEASKSPVRRVVVRR